MKIYVIAGLTLVLTTAAAAQTAISAKSGLINHLQGKALLDGAAVEIRPTKFVTVGQGSELRTEEGLVEVLLGPGAVLRMGENSAFKMVSSDVADTRVQLVSGSMIVERAEASKENSLTLLYKDSSIELPKNGVYRVDSSPARLMVYDGEARVHRDGQTQSVKKSRRLALDGVAVAEKFDAKNSDDAVLRWARRRAEYLAVANVSAARSMGRMGYSAGSYSGWVFNPYFGAFTYIPMSGVYDSFWGPRYWSMGALYDNYYYYGNWNRHGGGGSGTGTPTGYERVSPTVTNRSGVAARVSNPPASSGVGAGAGSGAGRSVSLPREPVRSGPQSRR
ncbi:MAG TPA: hypothetical protein VHA11_08105 [Bryobacteraceae bacterium]|nr:hypothetical protein [Bryobacteraceae bacterium]